MLRVCLFKFGAIPDIAALGATTTWADDPTAVIASNKAPTKDTVGTAAHVDELEFESQCTEDEDDVDHWPWCHRHRLELVER